MGKPELDELQYDNYILSGIIADLVKENKTLSAKIRVSDTDMAERIKTLESVNKRHQEEIKRLRKDCKEMAELLQKYDELVELALLVL